MALHAVSPGIDVVTRPAPSRGLVACRTRPGQARGADVSVWRDMPDFRACPANTPASARPRAGGGRGAGRFMAAKSVLCRSVALAFPYRQPVRAVWRSRGGAACLGSARGSETVHLLSGSHLATRLSPISEINKMLPIGRKYDLGQFCLSKLYGGTATNQDDLVESRLAMAVSYYFHHMFCVQSRKTKVVINKQPFPV